MIYTPVMSYHAAKPCSRVWIAPLLPPVPGRPAGPSVPAGLSGTGNTLVTDACTILLLVSPDLQVDPDTLTWNDLPEDRVRTVRLTSWAHAADQVQDQLADIGDQVPTVLVPPAFPEMALLALALDEVRVDPLQVIHSTAGSSSAAPRLQAR